MIWVTRIDGERILLNDDQVLYVEATHDTLLVLATGDRLRILESPTELVDRIGPLEAVLNSPSHHRVHHGSNPQYLDKNYGGIFIVWDRVFGTYEREVEPVVYGLTKNIHSYNLLTIAFHEWRALGRDLRATATWRDRARRLYRGPGWEPLTTNPEAPASLS